MRQGAVDEAINLAVRQGPSRPQLKRIPLDGNSMEFLSPPTISRPYRLMAWLIWGLLFPFTWSLLDLIVLSAGAPGPSHPNGWSWVTFALTNLAYLAVTIYMAQFMIAPFLVTLSTEGVDFVSVRGSRHLDWPSVVDARVRGSVVTLRGGGHTVRLNEYCYTKPMLLLPFLGSVLPSDLRSRVAV